ncbi:MAG TPA: hypothetical protein VIP09_08615 [Dehalococcoidia bacterium]
MWLLVVFHSGRDPRDFIRMGLPHLEASHASAVIKVDPHYHYYPFSVGGYDGQFYYYIAMDPANARYYFDQPTYRYTRILYPMLARVLALGRVDLVPDSLILINLLAIAGGTLAVAAWLKRRRVSPWFALTYGLFPGLFICLQRDLAEPLAFGLAAWGVYLLGSGSKHRLTWSALVFALAALTRETTIIFPVIYGLAYLFLRSKPAEDQRPTEASPRRRDTAIFLLIALAPLALYKVFLLVWLGDRSGGVAANILPSLVPFTGFTSWPFDASRANELISIIIPGIACALVALWRLRTHPRFIELWLLLANVLLFVVMLNHFSYVGFGGSGRVTTGVVLSALYCLPLFAGRRQYAGLWWLWASFFCWMFLWPSIAVFSDKPLGVPNFAVALGLVLALSWLTSSQARTASESLPDGSPRALRPWDTIRSFMRNTQSIP